MTLAEKLNEVSKELTESELAEVINYAEYVKQKNLKDQKQMIDEFIAENDFALKELAK